MVDDGSTDYSAGICDAYSARDPRFRVWHIPNGGQSSARNLALDNARGEFLTFVDGDDTLTDPLFFAKGINFLRCNRNVDLVQYTYCSVSPQGERYPPKYSLTAVYRDPKDYFANYYPICCNTPGCINVPVWGKIYRREVFDDIRFTPGRILEDLMINAHIFSKAKGIALQSDAVYAYTENPSGTMKRHNPRRADDALHANIHVLHRAIDALGVNGVSRGYFAKIFREGYLVSHVTGHRYSGQVNTELEDVARRFPFNFKPDSPALVKVLGAQRALGLMVKLLRIKNIFKR